MKLPYDPRYNIAYLRFREKGTDLEIRRISDELNIDIAPDGKIYGIEFLNANQQLFPEGQRKMVLINEELGLEREISIL